jgi:hypothetical protein
MADAAYHFLSFVRTGFAASITQPDTFGAGQPAVATAPVGVSVSGAPAPVTHDAVVRGPGDVIGISRSQVIRTDPIDGAVGVEPNYFVQIEFDRPDMPWLFTPATAAGQRLRPWIVLVVVDADGEAACTVRSGSPLPVLSVPAPAAQTLPDLADSHLWAHAQAILPDGMNLPAAFGPGADPRLTVSRLLCPRHLGPNRWYIAAVVPAFEVGRLAGLGQGVTPADEATLAPAWRGGAAVDLPVYHSWRFRTGEDADFERLARQLTGRPLPEGVGTRALDVAQPGAGLPALPTPADTKDTRAIVWLDGALRPIDSDSLPARDPAAAQQFQASLTVLLDRPADQVLTGNADPIVAPPIYGDKHALVVKLVGGAVPPWLSELNLEPRSRVAAGLGTQVIQARQEEYVARAWRQLGDVLAANRLLRAAQFARSGSLRVHQRLAALAPSDMLTMAYPVHQRVAGVTAPVALGRTVRDSRLPEVTVEPAFRRITRRSAAVARAAGSDTLAPAVVARFATEAFTAPTDGPDGSFAMRPAGEVIGGLRATVVLTGLGDAQPGTASRLDTIVTTLNANHKPLPGGTALRSGTLRTDAGAVAMMTSLGAAPGAAITAVLNAAAEPAPTPAHPPAGQPPVTHLPGGVQIPLGTQPGGHVAGVAPSGIAAATPHLAAGLAGDPTPAAPAGSLTARRGDLVFQPSGPSRTIGGGAAVRGGVIVLDNATIGAIARNAVAVRQVDDASWQVLQRGIGALIVNRAADPVSDVGSRLEAFRRDPTALTALAQVVNGDLSATLTLDRNGAALATTGAAAGALASLATGTFTAVLPRPAAQLTGPDDLAAGRELISAAAGAVDRMVLVADAPAAPPGPPFDLATVKAGLLTRLDPARTIAARINSRLTIGVVPGVPRRDDLDPVMACPRFDDPMWQALRDLGGGWLLPGLEKVPPDTATLVRTNPGFVAAHLVGLNHEIMRELLWREYPTDQRGTPFHRFWGRGTDDIGPVHLFAGALAANLTNHGADEAVLLLRSELLRRYPGSIIYLCRAKTGVDGQPQLDDTSLIPPSFRGDLPPDVSFIGFPITPDALRTTNDPWWFVIAQPPSEPRFGLDDWSTQTPAIPHTANDLAWNHMSADGHPDSPAPFAPGHAIVLQGITIDGLSWGDRGAAQAQLTYQHPVRVAIRATALLPPPQGAPP